MPGCLNSHHLGVDRDSDTTRSHLRATLAGVPVSTLQPEQFNLSLHTGHHPKFTSGRLQKGRNNRHVSLVTGTTTVWPFPLVCIGIFSPKIYFRIEMLQHMPFYIQKVAFGLTGGLVMINSKLHLPYGGAFPFQTAENANSFSSSLW